MEDNFYQVMLDWLALFARQSLADFHRFTHDAGLTLSQMNVMMRLYYQGSCEVKDLVDTMLVSKAAVSQMVERMVLQGLVQRADVPGDRRVKQVELTEKGYQFIKDSINAKQKWLEEIGNKLTSEQRTEIAHAIHLLAETVVRLDQDYLTV